MKPGYGNKKKKSKRKSKAKKDKPAGQGGDEMDTGDGVESMSDDGIDYTIPKDTSVTAELSAKDKQKSKMQLKKALKVKVSHLKQQRVKLTKVPGNKPQRKELSAGIKALVEEQKQLKPKKGKAGAKQPGQAANKMAE